MGQNFYEVNIIMAIKLLFTLSWEREERKNEIPQLLNTLLFCLVSFSFLLFLILCDVATHLQT